MSRLMLFAVCWAVLAGTALGDNQILGTGDGVFGIDQGAEAVTISTPGSYVFRAEDGTGGLGRIKRIRVYSSDPEHPVVSGTVTVGVYDWRTGPEAAGAGSVWECDLSGATDGRISTFRISGDYGEPTAGGTLRAENVDELLIGGSVVMPAGVASLGIAGGVTGSVAIGGNVESVTDFPTLGGRLMIGGDVNAPVTLGAVWGTVTVAGRIKNAFSWRWNGGNVLLTSSAAHTGVIACEMASAEHMVWCNGYAPSLRIQDIQSGGFVQLERGAGTVQVGEASGGEEVGGTLAINGDVTSMSLLHVMDLGAVYVSGTVGEASLNEFKGDLTLGGLGRLSASGSSPIEGRIAVGTLTGRLELPSLVGRLAVDKLVSTGKVTVTNSVSGAVIIGDSDGLGIAGSVMVGILAPSGALALNGAVNGTVAVATLAGTVTSGVRDTAIGPFAGLMTVGSLTGNLLLENGLAAGLRIQIGSKTADALVVVNNDGPNYGQDYWTGTVKIGTTSYTAEDRTQGLWEASCVVGDANSDDSLNTFDIDPFVLLLTDPANYCATYPGLCGEGYDAEPKVFAVRGSAFYRGDLNCDGAVNAFDIDPFVQKLTKQESWYATYECEVCPAGGLMLMAESAADGFDDGTEEAAEASAEEVAALLVSGVAPERVGALADVARTLATELPDAERAAFWAEVGTFLP